MSPYQRLFNQLRDLRNLEYFLKTPSFKDAERLANPDQKKLIEQLINCILCGPENLRLEVLSDFKALCERLSNRDVSLTDLRAKASQLGIRYYSRMTRDQLIEAINSRLYYDSRNLKSNNGDQGHTPPSGTESGQDSVHKGPTGEGERGKPAPRTGVADRIS